VISGQRAEQAVRQLTAEGSLEALSRLRRCVRQA
jgi:hypothetical protein